MVFPINELELHLKSTKKFPNLETIFVWKLLPKTHTMKKIIGYAIIGTMQLSGLGLFCYNLYTSGWYFVMAIFIGIGIVALCALGFYLINKD